MLAELTGHVDVGSKLVNCCLQYKSPTCGAGSSISVHRMPTCCSLDKTYSGMPGTVCKLAVLGNVPLTLILLDHLQMLSPRWSLSRAQLQVTSPARYQSTFRELLHLHPLAAPYPTTESQPLLLIPDPVSPCNCSKDSQSRHVAMGRCKPFLITI